MKKYLMIIGISLVLMFCISCSKETESQKLADEIHDVKVGQIMNQMPAGPSLE